MLVLAWTCGWGDGTRVTPSAASVGFKKLAGHSQPILAAHTHTTVQAHQARHWHDMADPCAWFDGLSWPFGWGDGILGPQAGGALWVLHVARHSQPILAAHTHTTVQAPQARPCHAMPDPWAGL